MGAAFGHRVFLIGFPIALILAWPTTSHPQGMGNANDIGARAHRRRILIAHRDRVDRFRGRWIFLLPRAFRSQARQVDSSAAVCNLSRCKENAISRMGVRTISYDLSKIGTSKVIFRNFGYVLSR